MSVAEENTCAIAANTDAIAALVEDLAAEIANRTAMANAKLLEAKAYAESVAKTPYVLPVAGAAVGGVKPDGSSTTVDPDGTIHAHVDVVATQTTLGGVMVDGATIVVHDGVISAPGSGGGGNLAGRTFDLRTNDDLFTLVAAIAAAMGATVNE